MPKSLGQIHTVNYENLDDSAGGGFSAGAQWLIDLPGQLTEQLQHMCRAMCSYKLVGIDMNVDQPDGSNDPLDVAMFGKIKYYAPTQGRVKALQMAYDSVRRMMKLSGVTPTDSITYDFRPPIADPATMLNGTDFGNQASIEDNGLATCLANGPGSSNIFGLYNQGIVPRQVVGTTAFFEEGFAIGLRSNAASADWTLNEKIYLSALTAPVAEEEYESIPWALAYNSNVANESSFANNFQWRPDPALYLSILTGQLILEVDQVEFSGEGSQYTLNAAFHVAGWKSILGTRHKKRRHSKRGGKNHGRKRTTRKSKK